MLAGLMLIVPALSRSQQPSAWRGRPVLFSDPKRETATTNLNQMTAKQLPLQRLEADLKRPFEIFDVADPSRRQVTTVPANYLPPAPTVKNSTDKNKDWAFKTQQDYEAAFGLTAAEIFKVPQYESDGQPKKKTTAMERAFDRMDSSHRVLTNQAGGLDSWAARERGDRKDDSNRSDMEKSPGSASMLDQALRRLSGTGDSRDPSSAADGKPRTIADVFGIGSAGGPNAELRAQELRLEEYRKILDPQVASPAVGGQHNPFGLSPATAAGNPASRGLNPLPGSSAPRESWSGLPGLVGAPSGVHGLADSTIRLPSLTAPLPQPEKPVAPPTPASFTVPKRKF